MRVYYLTSAEHAVTSIARRRIKVSSLDSVNDPFELAAMALESRELRAAFQKRWNEEKEAYGMLCFRRDWQSPVMWGHYGDRLRGIALGFNAPDETLREVKYLSERLVPKPEPTVELTPKLFDRLASYKYEDWAYEKEWRIRVPLSDTVKELGLHFMEFSDKLELAKVVIGPKCKATVGEIQRLVIGFKPAVEIVQARVAFESFRIVRDQSVTPSPRKS